VVKRLAHAAFTSYFRRFPIRKGKEVLLPLLWKPFSFGQYTRDVTLRHGSVRIHCDLTKFLQRHLYFFASYEEQQCAFWMEMASSATTIFDLGANIGLYSLLAARVAPTATIHAFEPTPELYESLVHHMRLNHFGNAVCNTQAIGSASGKGFLQRCGGSDGNNEAMNFVTTEQNRHDDPHIEIVSIDDYCCHNGIDHIDLMKIDIEGGEHDALQGARQSLSRKGISCIFIELSDICANRSGHSTVEIKRILLAAGYHLYRLGSRGLTRVPAEEVHEYENIIALAHEPTFPEPTQRYQRIYETRAVRERRRLEPSNRATTLVRFWAERLPAGQGSESSPSGRARPQGGGHGTEPGRLVFIRVSRVFRISR